MGRNLPRKLKGWAVLWEASSQTNEAGNRKVKSPIEVKARWLWRRRDGFDANGEPIVIDATVEIHRRVPVGSILWEGRLADWTGTGTGVNDNELVHVVGYTKTEGISQRGTYQALDLARFRDTLPELES